MKKPFVFGILLLALGAVPAQAQDYTGTLKIGGAVSSLSGNSNSDFEPRAGLAAGVAFGYDFGNGLAVIPEVIYVVKGAYADGAIEATDLEGNPIGSIPIRARFDLTYLEFPVLLTYRFGERNRFEPRLFAGPMVSYKLDARVRFRALDGDGPYQSEEDDSIQSFDYGATAGVGLGFAISDQRLVAELRGQYGQANVRRAEPALHNIGLAFFLGIQF